MISFGMSEEQELIRDTLREFAADTLRPIGRECDEASSIPEDVLQAAWELGLTSTQIPAEYGGGGEARAMVTNSIVLEELGYGDAAVALALAAPSQFANAILDHGTDEQKKQYLPLFCGEKFHMASLGLLEPGPVAEPMRPRTLAEPKGDGWVLSGQKSFVVLGDQASHFLIFARNSDRIDAFIVAREAEGLSISEPELNMGLKGLATVGLELERVLERSRGVRRAHFQEAVHCLSPRGNAYRVRSHAEPDLAGGELSRAGAECRCPGSLRPNLCQRKIALDRRQRNSSARRPRLYSRAPGGDVVSPRAHSERSRGNCGPLSPRPGRPALHDFRPRTHAGPSD